MDCEITCTAMVKEPTVRNNGKERKVIIATHARRELIKSESLVAIMYSILKFTTHKGGEKF